MNTYCISLSEINKICWGIFNNIRIVRCLFHYIKQIRLKLLKNSLLSSEYKELVDAAYTLKDGEYSTKVITTELGYHVIYRAETKEKAELEDVKDTILDALSTKYITENPVANVKAMQELRKEYGVEIVDTDIQTKYAESIQNELNYYQQLYLNLLC